MPIDSRDLTIVYNDAGYPVGVRAEDTQRRAFGSPMILWGGPLVDLPVTGSTAESAALVTFDIPPGLITPRSRIELRTLWTATNNANAKTARVRLGAGVLSSSNIASSACAEAVVNLYARTGLALAFPSMTAQTSGAAVITAVADWNAQVTLTVTMQLAVGTDTATLVAGMLTVFPAGF